MMSKLLPVVLVLIAVVLFAAYINPAYTGKIQPLQAEIADYDRALAAAADFRRKEVELAAEKNAIPAEAITRLETYLPDGVDNVQLILDLNALAARSGLQLSNFDIKEVGEDEETSEDGSLPLSGAEPVDSLELSVTATGSYQGFRAFLGGVEQSLRPLDLVQMTLADSKTGVYTYAMTFRIYWLH